MRRDDKEMIKRENRVEGVREERGEAGDGKGRTEMK